LDLARGHQRDSTQTTAIPATGKVLRDTASIGLQGLGDGRTSDYLSHAVFASLFHQEPRYFYQGTGSNKSRLYHAVSNAWVARSDSGKKMPNYSYLLGTMVSGAISNAYYPHADRGANLVFTNAFIGIAGRAGANVLQEFLGKRLTKNSSASANANP
jgi:hypothetical protein